VSRWKASSDLWLTFVLSPSSNTFASSWNTPLAVI
jgi:hypothetical protein